MKYFIITYRENNKYGANLERSRKVTVSKECADLGTAAKAALGIFISSTGNLKRNEIVSIQEIDEGGKAIGEPIKPVGDNAIVPSLL